jgi:hypothetical protein
MATSFRATGPGLYGFLADSDDDNIPKYMLRRGSGTAS